MKSAAIGVLLCSSFLGAGSRPKPSESLVIANVNVVDTRYGGIQPNATVVVKDGIITAIARFAVVDTGFHVRVVNAGGKFLVAGLWDLNGETMQNSAEGKSTLALYVVNGITGIRDTKAAHEVLAESAGDLPTPEILTSGPSLHPEFAPSHSTLAADAFDSKGVPGTLLHEQLESLVKDGLSPFRALQSATFNAALYMAKLDKYGVIERGHIADMILLEENPLEDIRNMRKIVAVVLRGTYYSRPQLDGLLAKAQRQAKQGSNTSADLSAAH